MLYVMSVLQYATHFLSYVIPFMPDVIPPLFPRKYFSLKNHKIRAFKLPQYKINTPRATKKNTQKSIRNVVFSYVPFYLVIN